MLDKYKDLKMAVLCLKSKDTSNEIIVNKSFEELFFRAKKKQESSENFLRVFSKKLVGKEEIHFHGTCYFIDLLLDGGDQYFFFSATSNSVNKSFLWIKHDLLNILNPIMGFSDVLLEMTGLPNDEKELISKIHQNSKKMYRQIDKLSLLQNLNVRNQIFAAEEYQLLDFVNEMADILLVNKYIDIPSTIHIQDDAYITAQIANHDFRSALETQIHFFLSYQNIKQANFNVVAQGEFLTLIIEFDNCIVPENYFQELLQMEKFLSECKYIDKVQIPGLNYLLLLQIVNILFGEVEITNETENKYELKIHFPISNYKKGGIHTTDNQSNNSNYNYKNSIDLSHLNDDLFKKIKKILKSFDGLIILDEWEKFAIKLERANKADQDKNILAITNNIREAIRLFDVDRLKKIHSDCRNAFLLSSD